MSQDKRIIAKLNDEFRRTAMQAALGQISPAAVQGLCHATQAVAALLPQDQRAIFEQIRDFNEFTPENDPWKEHDFGIVKHTGESYYFKIDYYDKNLKYGSEDPADPARTTRVITVMHRYDY